MPVDQDFPPYRIVKLAELVPYARNARTHSPAQVEQIAASMRTYGWTNPLLIDEKGVIAGHGRLLAAKLLGLTEGPAIQLQGLTDHQRRALILADNKIAENAGWDAELLKLELGELKLGGFDLALTGFAPLELSGIFDRTSGRSDPDEVPEPEPAVVSQAGDVWVLGRHRLACGDSTDAAAVASLLAGAKPHLMVTDPPYGVEYDAEWRNHRGLNGVGGATGVVSNDDRSDWRAAWMLFSGDVAYVWHADLHARSVVESLEAADFQMRAQIIWDKGHLVISRGHYHFQHEPCWYAVRKGKTARWAGDHKQSTVWAISKPRKSETGHSTQKPVECMRRPIENNSQVGDAVYEPFSGSGTTIIAAEMTGRRSYAMELAPNYVDLAVRRWEKFTGERATLAATGATFDETAATRWAAAEEAPAVEEGEAAA